MPNYILTAALLTMVVAGSFLLPRRATGQVSYSSQAVRIVPRLNILPESDKLSASSATISAPKPRLVPPPEPRVAEYGDPTFMQIYLAVVLGNASHRLLSQLIYADFISRNEGQNLRATSFLGGLFNEALVGPAAQTISGTAWANSRSNRKWDYQFGFAFPMVQLTHAGLMAVVIAAAKGDMGDINLLSIPFIAIESLATAFFIQKTSLRHRTDTSARRQAPTYLSQDHLHQLAQRMPRIHSLGYSVSF